MEDVWEFGVCKPQDRGCNELVDDLIKCSLTLWSPSFSKQFLWMEALGSLLFPSTALFPERGVPCSEIVERLDDLGIILYKASVVSRKT